MFNLYIISLALAMIIVSYLSSHSGFRCVIVRTRLRPRQLSCDTNLELTSHLKYKEMATAI